MTGEERRHQRDFAKQRNMDFPLPSLKDIFKMQGFSTHKYISSAKQAGKAVTFAEVLLNRLGLCVEGEKDLGPGSLP